MTYYLFERDLTSNHVSYHFCFLNLDQIDFPNKSKIKEDYEFIFDLINNNLRSVHSLPYFHKAITPANKFIETPYFHLSLNASKEDYLLINECFKIKTDYKYCYFTKKIADLTSYTDFKCGFLMDEFSNIEHKMKNESIKIANKFLDYSSQILYAFDFDLDGNVINDNINIEILPSYSLNSFYKIKETVVDLFPHIDIDVLDKYDSMFSDYHPEKFHFHFKIKLYSDKKPTVKFYRTYNSKNPYLR